MIVATRTTKLSAREIEVLTLIAKGFTGREIGLRLGLAQKTVESHTLHIYQKLNVNRRAEAAVEAVRRGYA
jgi:DNA-binding NarL/FixJ family response regulator